VGRPRADTRAAARGGPLVRWYGLFVDMVPRSCWFTNVRTCVTPQDWERLRRMITSRAGQRCEACGAAEDRAAGRRLEAHERWAYDENTGVQALRRLICLCSDCHSSTHFGHANVTGRAEQALAHLRRVTGMTDAEVADHVRAAGEVWTSKVSADVGTRSVHAHRRRGHAHPARRGRRACRRRRTRAAPRPHHRPRSGVSRPTHIAATRPGTIAAAGPASASPADSTPKAPARTCPGGSARTVRSPSPRSCPRSPPRHGLDRLRRRSSEWRVLHSVPVGTGRGDIDHVLIGRPGVVTINTKHHRAGRLALNGDELIVNGRPTDHIPKARREAERAAAPLGS